MDVHPPKNGINRYWSIARYYIILLYYKWGYPAMSMACIFDVSVYILISAYQIVVYIYIYIHIICGIYICISNRDISLIMIDPSDTYLSKKFWKILYLRRMYQTFDIAEWLVVWPGGQTKKQYIHMYMYMYIVIKRFCSRIWMFITVITLLSSETQTKTKEETLEICLRRMTKIPHHARYTTMPQTCVIRKVCSLHVKTRS